MPKAIQKKVYPPAEILYMLSDNLVSNKPRKKICKQALNIFIHEDKARFCLSNPDICIEILPKRDKAKITVQNKFHTKKERTKILNDIMASLQKVTKND